MLVLELRNTGGDDNVVKLVGEALASQLAKSALLEVLTAGDIKSALDLEAQKRALECGDESCLAEIASALGAEYVVSGSVGTIGALTVVNVAMMNGKTAASMGRESVEAKNAEELLASTRSAADRLGALITGVAVVAPAESAGSSAGLVIGVIVTSAGVVGAGIGGAILGEALSVTGDVRPIGAGGADAKEKTDAVGRVDPALLLTGAGLAMAIAGVVVAVVSMGEP